MFQAADEFFAKQHGPLEWSDPDLHDARSETEHGAARRRRHGHAVGATAVQQGSLSQSCRMQYLLPGGFFGRLFEIPDDQCFPRRDLFVRQGRITAGRHGGNPLVPPDQQIPAPDGIHTFKRQEPADILEQGCFRSRRGALKCFRIREGGLLGCLPEYQCADTLVAGMHERHETAQAAGRHSPDTGRNPFPKWRRGFCRRKREFRGKSNRNFMIPVELFEEIAEMIMEAGHKAPEFFHLFLEGFETPAFRGIPCFLFHVLSLARIGMHVESGAVPAGKTAGLSREVRPGSGPGAVMSWPVVSSFNQAVAVFAA